MSLISLSPNPTPKLVLNEHLEAWTPMDRAGAGLLLIAGMAAVAGCSQAAGQPGPPQQQEALVVYDTPITQTVTDYEDFPGWTQAIYTVEVRARVSGYLKKVCFQDGQEVKKDDVLFLIDPRPFQATFDRQKATLEQAEAHAVRLNNEYRRAKILFDQARSVSREEFDRYAFDHAEAEAALSTAKANLELARLDLDWTKVKVDLPEGVTGRLSRRMVDPGNLIKADDTLMTTIVSQDPLYVYFDVHEQAMLRIRRLLQEGMIHAKSDREVPIEISLSDEKDPAGNPVFSHQGIVDFTDNRVDQNTGTLRFRAQMSNPNHFITPGLFVKVRLPIGDAHPALMVREQSLQSDQGLKKVFVLQAKDEHGNPYFILDPVTKQPVLDEKGQRIPGYMPIARDLGPLGVLRGKYREVNQGIKAGDLIVAKGMQKIRLGSLVKAKPWSAADDVPGSMAVKTVGEGPGKSATTDRPVPGGPSAGPGSTPKSLAGEAAVATGIPAAKASFADQSPSAGNVLANPSAPARPAGRGSRSGARH
jgi:multidrug efflux system membrane fusion protein